MKYIKLEKEGLAAARIIRDNHKQMRIELNDFKQEILDEIKAIKNRHNEIHQMNWDLLCEVLNIDPSGNYSLDTEYLDDLNIAFLKIPEPGDEEHKQSSIADLIDALSRSSS